MSSHFFSPPAQTSLLSFKHKCAYLICYYGFLKGPSNGAQHTRQNAELGAPRTCSSFSEGHPLIREWESKNIFTSFSFLLLPPRASHNQVWSVSTLLPSLLFHFCPLQTSKAMDLLTSPLCEQFLSSCPLLSPLGTISFYQVLQGLLWSGTCPQLLPYLVLFSALTLVPLRKKGLAKTGVN